MTSFAHKISLFFIMLVIIATPISCRLKKQATPTAVQKQRTQLQYIPILLHETYLGMPFADFKKARMVIPVKDTNSKDFRIVYTETIDDNDIRKITYYFDKDNNQPLYQYIIEYNSFAKLQEVIQQKYGKKNDGSQWIFDSGEGFMISVWTFEKTLCIAGLIEGTEWDR
jgi:hypothetical protein